jgi:hypothetical protein
LQLHDALFNWLQIKLLADARPEDEAARQTARFFEQMLSEDHQIDSVRIAANDAAAYIVEYVNSGIAKRQKFDREAAEALLRAIESDPKYNSM